MENTDIPVPVPSLWFGHGSQSLYTNHEASSDLPQTLRDQTSPVSGRHTAGGRVPRSTQGTLEKGSKPARGTRFLTQKEEMCLDTNPENRVLGIQGRLEHHAPLPSIQEAGEDQEGMQECERITVRRLRHLIGLLTSTIPPVLPAPLHYRALQLLKGKAIRNSCHNYNTVISLDEDPVKDLDWWIVQVSGSNGKPIKLPKAERIVESDASTTGWGASCQGVQTGGPHEIRGKPRCISIGWRQRQSF